MSFGISPRPYTTEEIEEARFQMISTGYLSKDEAARLSRQAIANRIKQFEAWRAAQ